MRDHSIWCCFKREKTYRAGLYRAALLKVSSTDSYSYTNTSSFEIRSHKRQGWLKRSSETSDQ